MLWSLVQNNEKKRICSLRVQSFLADFFLMINSFRRFQTISFALLIVWIVHPRADASRVVACFGTSRRPLCDIERRFQNFFRNNIDKKKLSINVKVINWSCGVRTNIYVQRTWNQKQTNFRFMTFSGLRKQQQNCSSFALRLRRKERDWWAASLLLRLMNGLGGFRVECSSGFRFNRDTSSIWSDLTSFA